MFPRNPRQRPDAFPSAAVLLHPLATVSALPSPTAHQKHTAQRFSNGFAGV
jgi:hypothetical protein